MPENVSGVWIARFHYRTPDDIVRIMENCASVGINSIYWQVRGEGTVLYPSQYEPWAQRYDYRDPGFDPLAIAVAEAHRRGMRIEAWMNVMPGWKGPKQPPIPDQHWNARPEWFLRDAQDQRQPLGNYYVILNPCLPEVRNHIASIAEELVTRYALDGVHLDYVRYAWDTTPKASERYPRDPRTLSIYREETGLVPDDDPGRWDHWRANQITRLVHEIRDRVNQRRPGATLSAAVWRNPGLGYDRFLQNAVAWLRADLIDAAMPMAYTTDFGQLQRDIRAYERTSLDGRIIPGIGLYKFDTPEQFAEQLGYCMQRGGDCCLFSYESLWPIVAERDSGPLRPALRQTLQRYTSDRG